MNDISGFSAAERSAMRLDGDVFELWNGAILADEPDVLETRVRLARGEAPDRYILDGRSAAWAWRARDLPPSPPEFCVSMDRRGTDRIGTVRVQRYVRLTAADIVETASGAVLSPWRTFLHSLRWTDDATDAGLRALLTLCRETIPSARERLIETLAPNQLGRYLPRFDRLSEGPAAAAKAS